MKIQSLTIDSAKELSRLNELNFNDGWTESMITSAFNGGRFFAFGAINEENLVGSVTISLGDEDADIEGIVVDKEQRGKGIALQLINLAHQHHV